MTEAFEKRLLDLDFAGLTQHTNETLFTMKVLVVDVRGHYVKILATEQEQSRKLTSAPTLTAGQVVAGVKDLAEDWDHDAVSIGYPGPRPKHSPAGTVKSMPRTASTGGLLE